MNSINVNFKKGDVVILEEGYFKDNKHHKETSRMFNVLNGDGMDVYHIGTMIDGKNIKTGEKIRFSGMFIERKI